MSGVSSAESAALVLRFLETSGFRRTAGTFRREASKLLKSIVAPPTVKPLIGVLNEYVELKEADSRRKQLAQANSVVGDLLAVIENHASKASAQPNQADMQHGPSSAEQDSEPQLPVNGQPHEGDMLASEPAFSAMDGMAAVEHVPDATPAHQQADQYAKRLASSFPRPQSSSQHRKGAPRRRPEQSGRAASPVSRLALSSLGDSQAAGTEWMNLPMTEDGFSSLMQDDSFQRRFAEGLATHLTSGAEVGTDNHYNALLASLPADPAMAGLLEPLVLPADAYQIPAETHQLLAAHPSDQEASADQHQPLPQMHQTASDPIGTLAVSAALSSQNGAASLPTHACVLMQSVAKQQQPADQPSHPAGVLGLQQDVVSCHSLQHAGDARAPYPQKLQQPGQQNETQAASAQLHPETVAPSTLPLQHPAGMLSVAAVPSQSCTQSTAHAQQAAGFCGQGKLSMPVEELEDSGPNQLQGLPSASTSLPAADQPLQKHGAQQLVRCNIGADEAAALDSLYATIFPNRQVARASTGAPKPSRTSQGRRGYLQDTTAAPREAATAVLCNLADDQLVPTATESAGPSSRKRQRTPNSPDAAAQPASSALPDQHTEVMSCGSSGIDPEQGRFNNDQQQQQQQYLTQAAAPAYEEAQEGEADMACGGTYATEHISSVIPACASNAAETDDMAAGVADCDADPSPSGEDPQRPVLASLPSNQLLDAFTAGAVAGVDAVQLSGAQWKVPQEVLRQGQTIASFNPAAIEEFIKALHGKS